MKTNSYSWFRLFCGCLCLCLFLSACSGVTKFTIRDDGGLYNAKSKQSYAAAPYSYRAYTYNPDDVVGIYVAWDGTEQNLYRVTGSGNYCCNEYYEVYLPEGTSLPTLSELHVTEVDLCQTNSQIALATYTDANEIAEILSLFQTVSIPYSRLPRFADANYRILFADPSLGLILELNYLVFEEAVVLYEQLNPDGSAPALYGVEPTIEEVSGERVAVYDLGTQLLLDRSAGVCYISPELL